MTYLPENEPELMIILKRERLNDSYHATAGNLEEYLDKLEKTTCGKNSKEQRRRFRRRRSHLIKEGWNDEWRA